MKSIKDLEAIRQRTLDEVNLRNDRHGIRVVVGMGTCGISAGARPVMIRLWSSSNGWGPLWGRQAANRSPVRSC
mgnify:CR=1 FL=1